MAMEINPEDSNAYNRRGNAKNNLGQQLFYIGLLLAIEINPIDSSFYNNRGNAMKIIGQILAANEYYSEAIEINPKYVDACYNKGIAKKNLGKYKATIQGRSMKFTKGFILKMPPLNKKMANTKRCNKA